MKETLKHACVCFDLRVESWERYRARQWRWGIIVHRRWPSFVIENNLESVKTHLAALPPPNTLAKLFVIPFICSSFAFSSSTAISLSHFSPFSRISFSKISYCLCPL